MHLIRRVKDQYFMSLFEGGALGLAAFVLIAGTALTGAMARGDQMAAAVAAALVAFLFSGVFEYPLEVPRLAALFYIIVFCGLTMTQLPAPGREANGSDRSLP